MEGPAQTLTYMIAGYVVIFGIITGYIASLVLRWRKLNREHENLQDLSDGE